MSAKLKMEDFIALGWRRGPMIGKAIKLQKLMAKRDAATPEAFLDALRAWDGVQLETKGKKEATLAAELASWMAKNKPAPATEGPEQVLFDKPCAYKVWGQEGIDDGTLQQMNDICRLPSATRGALMPDAHVGYSMPIGGVLAARDAVIPAAVGVDIACRMRISLTALPFERFAGMAGRLRKALVEETRFGMGAAFQHGEYREHAVMDDPRWNDLPGHIRAKKHQYWTQLGSSGGGNHFVEWGSFSHDLDKEDAERSGLGALDRGKPYVALLSHSGSRGLGARTADYFINQAKDACPLPPNWRHLAWLPLLGDLGQQYWLAMNLCGDYASANHQLIHEHVLKAAGIAKEFAASVENHHNFAWKEEHDGQELIVHRKGATPAGLGVKGVIPGSMADPAFLVEGKGSAESLCSASHGAGRKMSRKGARESVSRSEWRDYLDKRGVELISAGVDEAPMAYKDIREVMARQADLARVLGQFDPKMVLMADDEGPPKWAKKKKKRAE